jgi:hypothetical protein
MTSESGWAPAAGYLGVLPVDANFYAARSAPRAVPAERPIGQPGRARRPASIAWGILGSMVENELPKPQDNAESSPATGKPEHSFRDVRHYVPQDILDVSFPSRCEATIGTPSTPTSSGSIA